MKSFLTLFTTLFLLVLIQCSNNEISKELILKTRKQVMKNDVYKAKIEEVTLLPDKIAIIICDMWDTHTCLSAAKRVDELAPFMNDALKTARNKGIFIIHAPSGCMKFYKNTPQRKLAQDAPFVKAPNNIHWNNLNSEIEKKLPGKLGNFGCSCDKKEPCFSDDSPAPWTRQNTALEIFNDDAISDNGQEIYNLIELKGIDNVIIMGVHTNICVLGRPFGIRQLVYNEKNVFLCRDLTDAFFRDPDNHFEGNNMIVDHIEKYWCPTITSESITGTPRFFFSADNTNRIQ